MSQAFAATTVAPTRSEERPLRLGPPRKSTVQPTAPARSHGEDPEFAAALIGVLRDQRMKESRQAADLARAIRVERTVCDFLEDDLREITDAMADVEAYFQESLEALLRPTTVTLLDRVGDPAVLKRVEDLHNSLANLRRRMVQVAAGVSRHEGRNLEASSSTTAR